MAISFEHLRLLYFVSSPQLMIEAVTFCQTCSARISRLWRQNQALGEDCGGESSYLISKMQSFRRIFLLCRNWVGLVTPQREKKAVCFRDNVFDKSLCLAVKEKNMQRQKAYRGSNHGAQHVPGRWRGSFKTFHYISHLGRGAATGRSANVQGQLPTKALSLSFVSLVN